MSDYEVVILKDGEEVVRDGCLDAVMVMAVQNSGYDCHIYGELDSERVGNIAGTLVADLINRVADGIF